MKKLVAILLIFTLFFTLCACKEEQEKSQTEKSRVTINMPNDDSVNGYRIISDNDNSQSETENATNCNFCANKNSKVFHKTTCSSVAKMKDSNKYFSNDKSTLTAEGYKPCNYCKP